MMFNSTAVYATVDFLSPHRMWRL